MRRYSDSDAHQKAGIIAGQLASVLSGTLDDPEVAGEWGAILREHFLHPDAVMAAMQMLVLEAIEYLEEVTHATPVDICEVLARRLALRATEESD